MANREETSALCATFRQERSQNGKTLSELKSGLQKYIRRGEITKALWCAGELYSFRRAPEQDRVQCILTNFRHRLMIIFLEDVGAIGLWEQATRFNRIIQSGNGGPAIAAWVEMMAMAPKSRACSHARAVASLRDTEDCRVSSTYTMAHQFYPAITALHHEHRLDTRSADANEGQWREALTTALQKCSPAACLWAWAIATKGVPRTTKSGRKSVWQIFDVLEYASRPEIAALIPTARLWYKDLQNTQEAFLCWMLPLLAQIGKCSTETNIDNTMCYNLELYNALATAFDMQDHIELDDYVFDIHVGPGSRATGPRKRDGGLTRFAEEGSIVANESPIVDPIWKAFYNDSKRIKDRVNPVGPPTAVVEVVADFTSEVSLPDDFIDSLLDEINIDNSKPLEFPVVDAYKASFAPKAAQVVDKAITYETQYKLLVRAQINTSQNKTDVYFAYEPDTRKTVVVKGPFASRGPVDRAIEMSQWKRENGLPAIECQAVPLIPDRWPEGVPLGIRNRVDRTTPSWFLVSNSLLGDTLPRRLHSSKVWPQTEVIDWSDPVLNNRHVWAPLKHWVTYSVQEKNDYVIALLARYVVGISDLADRNFLRAGGRLYSLDEDGRVASNAWVQIASELRVDKALKVRLWAEDHWAEIEPVVASWCAPVGAEGRLHDIRTRLNALKLFTEFDV